MFICTISCPHCGEKITEDWSDYITDTELCDDDRGMGEEYEHTVYCEEFECPKCRELFTVSGHIWEYPVGAYNSDDLRTDSVD